MDDERRVIGGGRHLELPLDMGGGGEGGGSGGAGGGSWTVVGLGGGTPEEPDGDGRAADTGPYVIDRFTNRTVSPPSTTAGSSAGTFAVAGWCRQSRTYDMQPWALVPDQDEDYTEHAFAFIAGRADRPESTYVESAGHTSRPTWTACVGLDWAMIGYSEAEQWFKLTVGAHPADAAGISLEVVRAGGRGYGAVGSMDVVVASAQPTALRQGTAVGQVGPGGSATLVIPIASVPAEGGELWVGFRCAWETAFKTRVQGYVCGWPQAAGFQSWQTDDAGNAYGGFSGDIAWTSLSSPTWLTYTAGEDDFGETTLPDGAPFGGPHAWQAVEQVGSPEVGIDADGFYVESTANATKAIALVGPGEDEDADDGAWSAYDGCRLDVLWSMDAVGLTGQAGTRTLEVQVEAEGQACLAKVHLGDGSHAAGISADGGAGSAYKAKALEADTRYVLAVDTRSGMLRAKLWADAGRLSEPALWDVEVPIAPSLSEADRFTLRARVGNIISSQRVTVHRVDAYAAARQGDTVAWELIGLADGSARVYPTAHQYEPGSLVASAAGIIAKPQTEWGQAASFAADFPPTTGAILRCRYVVAGPEAED